VEASAKSGVGVEEAFIEASRDILRKIERGAFEGGLGKVSILVWYGFEIWEWVADCLDGL